MIAELSESTLHPSQNTTVPIPPRKEFLINPLQNGSITHRHGMATTLYAQDPTRYEFKYVDLSSVNSRIGYKRPPSTENSLKSRVGSESLVLPKPISNLHGPPIHK
jgi:hypothetical protein